MSDTHETLTRRSLLMGGTATIVAVGAGVAILLASQNATPAPDPRPVATQPLNLGGVVARLTILHDLTVLIQMPTSQSVLMQTNGMCLCVESVIDMAMLDLSKIAIEVEDTGHDMDGNQVQTPRLLRVRDYLHGPYNELAAVTGGPRKYFLVLDDRIYNQSALWYSKIKTVTFADGWISGYPGEIVAGELVERQDTLPYPPFPVKTPSLPFRRMDGVTPVSFEVAVMNEFARNGSMVARVEAWPVAQGTQGQIAFATGMTSSLDAGPGTPSALPVPVYKLDLNGVGLLDGPGEIFFKVYPWIGPHWSSQDSGELYPTLNAPRSLPFCNDQGGSYAPLYGIVSQDGTGLAGTDLRGLSFTLAGAKLSGLLYRDCAAVATAVKIFNASSTSNTIADGLALRPVPHNDIAAGVAVLLPITGSVAGGNGGSYALRTGFASQSLYPPGLVPFEIRSELGTPDQTIRLRGVLPTGVATSATNRQVPSRLLLRGIWLDGTGTTGSQNSCIDGTLQAGASVSPLSAVAAAYQMTVDCVITESPGAGAANPVRLKPGYIWDVRLRHEGASGLTALHTVKSYSGLVASIGSFYTRQTATNGIILSTLLGCRFINISITGQTKSIQPLIKGQLMINIRVDFDQVFSTPLVGLAASVPVMGGLGIGNVFLRGSVDSGGPMIQIGADGTLREIDNVLMRHVGHDLTTASSATNGRVNLLYQDQGYTRVDKYGTSSFCAYRCYTTKGDVFPATQKASAAGASWVQGPYDKGSIVWDTVGAATAASVFYQSLVTIPAQGAALTDTTSWQLVGTVFGKAYGAQPLRQGNAAFRYHIGCRGNVASVTYNGAVFPGTSSGYGFVWGPDEYAKADFTRFYRDRNANDYAPKSIAAGDSLDSPLLNRVGPGWACFPFDLAGMPRLNDGAGAAGAYERLLPPPPPPPPAAFVTNY